LGPRCVAIAPSSAANALLSSRSQDTQPLVAAPAFADSDRGRGGWLDTLDVAKKMKQAMSIKTVIPEVRFLTIFSGILPFILTDILRLVILIGFPVIATYLPSHMR
jgi:hypothetical protein